MMNGNTIKNEDGDYKENLLNLMTKSNEEIAKQMGQDASEEERSLHDQINNEDESGHDQEKDSSQNKSLYNRMFSRMEAGSLRGSILAMSALALGTGSLAIPYRFHEMSLLGAIMIILIVASVAYWSMTLMIQVSETVKQYDYSRLVKHSLGKNFALMLDIFILIYIFGTIISYLVIIYALIGLFVHDLFYINEYPVYEDFDREIWKRAVVQYPIMFGFNILLIPFCMLKDISKMRIVNFFSIVALLYCIAVILIQCPWFFIHYLKTTDDGFSKLNFFDITKGFNKYLYFFQGCATIIFSFTMHVGAFPVYKTLHNNVTRRINKVFRRSIIFDTVIYICVGLAGYFTQPLAMPELVIYRKNTIFENDLFMIVARLGFAVNLLLSIPSNYNAYRISMLELVFKTNEVTTVNNIVVTVPSLLIGTLIAILFDKITTYISILGGFIAVIIGFLMPGLLYIKNNKLPLTHKTNISTIAVVSVICITGYIAGFMTVYELLSKDEINA